MKHWSIVALVTLVACGGTDESWPVYELAGQAMGTTYSIKLVAPDEKLDRDGLGTDIRNRIAAVENRMSTYIEDSELSRFNRARNLEWIPVSAELCALVERAIGIGERTGGAFDITVGPLVNLWGFGAEGSRIEPPAAALVRNTLERTGIGKLHADCRRPALRKDRADLYLDLSGIAKGYAVDAVAALLDARHLASFLVEIGGELRMHGYNGSGESWAIAVERPAADTRSVQSIVHLTDAAMATSGDYRNFFEFEGRRYSHTINPHSGWPISHEGAAVTVVGDSAAEADALATALLVLGPGDGLAFAAREGIAAYFLLRTEHGIEERSTGEFAALLN